MKTEQPLTNFTSIGNHSSEKLAADSTLVPLWDPSVPFPSAEDMQDVDIITHVSVEKAKPNGYHYLHEAALAFHKNKFYLGWANHPVGETGDHDELIRGCFSDDGLHWSKPEIWAEAPMIESTSFNHPLLFSHNETLYGFFVCWRQDHYPVTELFIRNERSGTWEHQKNSAINGFVPFCTPQKLENGNWIIGGEHHWYNAAAAISNGDDLLHWNLVDIPKSDDFQLLYPEASIIHYGGGRLTAVCRPTRETLTAPVSESNDNGLSWSPLSYSNFPLSDSQPFAGRLSTGQNYLITNHLEEGRALLTIAVTKPGGKLFQKIFKIRHQRYPRIRHFKNNRGQITQWAYPNALEHEGNLYIAYSQGKEDCTLSIIPVETLSV